MRYKINQTINDQFLGEFNFLQVFGFQEDSEWYVYEDTLIQIDRSGEAQKSVNQACLDLYAMTKAAFFDPKIDTSYQNFMLQEKKTEEGFSLYKKIIGDINDNGGLTGYLDDDQIPSYENHFTAIRNMLKDGFPEMALRKYVTDIASLSLLPTEQDTIYMQWIEDLAVTYGADQALIDLIKTVPKGQYPFGATGAP